MSPVGTWSYCPRVADQRLRRWLDSVLATPGLTSVRDPQEAWRVHVEQSLSALAPFGRLAVFGAASGTTNKVETGRLMAGSRAVIGFWLIHCITRPGMLAEPLAELFERVGRGELRAIVGETYPLGEITRAHADMQARRTSGKLLLDPSA